MVLDITMDDRKTFFYNLDVIKGNSRSIYATGIYGNIYRLVKKDGAVYIDSKLIGTANSYSYF